jgi:hypothetical protein
MNEILLVEIWDLLREYADKKQLSVLAEKYVDILGENGVSEQNLENALGHDEDLDEAIKSVLDLEEPEDYDND